MPRLDKVLPVQVEDWPGSIERENPTKAKIRYVFSALCGHALPWGWLTRHPDRGARQSAEPLPQKVPLTVDELQALFGELDLMDRALVVLDVPTGMRLCELLTLRWRDIDFEQKMMSIRKSIRCRPANGRRRARRSRWSRPRQDRKRCAQQSESRDLVAWFESAPPRCCTSGARGKKILIVYLLVYHAVFWICRQVEEKNGRHEETRTPDLFRVKEAL